MDTRAFYKQDYEAQMREPAGEVRSDGQADLDLIRAVDPAREVEELPGAPCP